MIRAHRPWAVAVLAGLCFVAPADAQDYVLEQPLPGPAVTSSFGRRVAVDDNTAVVGDALVTAGGVVNAGSVDVYVKQGGAWGLQQRLTAAGAQNREFFGAAVSLDGDTLAMGASADLSGRPDKVYVYTRNGTT